MKRIREILAPLRDVYAHRNEPEALHILAQYYWRGLLVTAFVLLVAVFANGTWTLRVVADDLAVVPDKFESPPTMLDRVQLSAVLSDFALRKQAYEALRSGGAKFSDPSRK